MYIYSTNSVYLLHNLHLLQKVIPCAKSHTLVKQEDDKDTSKPLARHLNLSIHSKQHMVVCSLSLHLGSWKATKL